MATLQLAAAQISRMRTLSQRLATLEAALRSNIPAAKISAILASQSKTDQISRLYDQIRRLEHRISKLELTETYSHDALQSILDIEERLEFVEDGVSRIDKTLPPTANVKRVVDALATLEFLPNVEFLRVPDGTKYYEVLDLEQRAKLLHGPSPAHLYKTLLFSTSGGRFDDEEPDEEKILNEKYVMLVLPYDSKVDASKFRSSLKSVKLLELGANPCLASPGRAAKVLGFPFNGVCFVGGSTKVSKEIPIIFAETIRQLSNPVIFVGGGEPDIKLRVNNVLKLIERMGNAHILDVTEKRSEETVVSVAKMKLPGSATGGKSNGNDKPLSNSPQSKNKRSLSGDDSNDGDGSPPKITDFDLLDVRIGQIISANVHPASEKLMCEMIDIGEGSPRPIVSGIQKFYKPQDLVGRRVCVVANLKPASLAGEKSFGMVLCATWTDESGKDCLCLVEPPLNAAIGSRITAAENSESIGVAANPNLVKKRKLFESISENLSLDGQGEKVVYLGRPLGSFDSNGKQVCTVPKGKPFAKVS